MRETLDAMTNPITIRVFVHKSKAFLKIFSWFVKVWGDILLAAGLTLCKTLQSEPVNRFSWKIQTGISELAEAKAKTMKSQGMQILNRGGLTDKDQAAPATHTQH